MQVLMLSCFHDLSAAAFEMFVNCPHWKNVRDFHYSVNVDGAAGIFARSPLVPRLVSLGCHEYQRAEAIPAAQALPRLRRSISR